HIKWISNPVNEEENFADKWPENPKKEQNFYKWLNKVKSDLASTLGQKGIHRIQESFSKSFGEDLIKTSFRKIADRAYENREAGNLHMKMGSGILSSETFKSTSVKSHNFHGKNKG
ncbi:MAG: nucleotidyltransferase, partial [Bacteroidales bacterium]|nr:nucleotidyltransferase [Bacteroidales bacterium]